MVEYVYVVTSGVVTVPVGRLIHMFERFTDRARRAVNAAHKEAELLGHTSVGTEHLLLALASEDAGAAVGALEKLGLSYWALREKVVELFGKADVSSVDKIPEQPCLNQVYVLASRVSKELQSNYIGAGHVLFAIMRTAEDTGAHQVLAQFGRTREEVERAVIEALDSSGQW